MNDQKTKLYTDLLDAAIAIFRESISDYSDDEKQAIVSKLCGETKVIVSVELPSQNVSCAMIDGDHVAPLFTIVLPCDESTDAVH